MTAVEVKSAIKPNPSFHRLVERKSQEKITSCYQCQKCTNGCPLTFAMDIVPHKLMRSIQLGLKDEVLRSDTIWVCASCETCTTRCPNNIDIAHIMDSLRQISQKEGIKASQPQIPIFHKSFLASVKRFGRVHEGEMAAMFALRSGGIKKLLSLTGMARGMFKKGKVKILPHPPHRQVRKIFGAAERRAK